MDLEIDKVVEYIITPPYHTIMQTAEYFNCSRNKINRLIKLLGNKESSFYNDTKYKIVEQILDKKLAESRAKAGSMGKRKNVLSEKEALELRFKNVYQKIPLRKLAQDYHCSHMSISNAIKMLSKEKIQIQDMEAQKIIENLSDK